MISMTLSFVMKRVILRLEMPKQFLLWNMEKDASSILYFEHYYTNGNIEFKQRYTHGKNITKAPLLNKHIVHQKLDCYMFKNCKQFIISREAATKIKFLISRTRIR